MSYGRGFKKVGKTKNYRDKKTGRYTSDRHLKASRTMQKRYGGKLGKWNRGIEKYYSELRKYGKFERDVEPVIGDFVEEYE